MNKFGSIQGPSGGARPNGIRVSFITGKCAFFMGDRWIPAGEVMLAQTRGGAFFPVLPDFDLFFEGRKGLNDGTDEWRKWGPRVN